MDIASGCGRAYGPRRETRRFERGFLERLEQRRMLALLVVIGSEGSGDDRIVATFDPARALLVVNNNGVTTEHPWDADSELLIEGGGSNDNIRLSGVPTRTTVVGGSGNDTLSGSVGDDVLDGGSEGDVLFGGGGDDTLIGGSEDDRLSGHGGNDVIDGGSGTNVIDAGDGDDVISSGGSGSTINGGAGNDTINFVGANGIIHGGDGDDIVRAGAGGDDVIYGGAGNDDIDSGSGADLVFGHTGLEGGETSGIEDRDTIRTGSGDDTVYGGADDDWISTGSERDTIYGDYAVMAGGFGGVEQGDDTIDGGGGSDVIYGDSHGITSGFGGGDDHLSGGSGENVIYGDGGEGHGRGITGDDTFLGVGRDTLRGEDGSDRYVLRGGAVVVEAGEAESFGRDTIDFSGIERGPGARAGITFDLGSTGPQSIGVTLSHADGIEDLVGTRYDDRLAGNGLANVITGGDGDDVFLIRDGVRDTVFGGSGNDRSRLRDGERDPHDVLVSVEDRIHARRKPSVRRPVRSVAVRRVAGAPA